jgi:hypothetical protein
VELVCRHAARLLPLLWATCLASELLSGRFNSSDEIGLTGDNFFVLLGLDAMYPQKMVWPDR